QMASSQRPDYVVDRAWPGITYKDHYQETNSAGSMLAPAYACTMWELLGLDPASSAEGRKACDEWNAWKNGVVTHVGTSSPPNPQGDPEAEATPIRHY
ncbi:MAG TPA: hypothetical protein VNE62_06970, partial [Actinomycetota bacterium]|nr:hypothetical protein [Actinomycetota bacterium]